jgi:4-amino-4-deoxy-L-arabinose transferase-like glycosyltransferase
MSGLSLADLSRPARPKWCEPEVAAICLLVLATYFLRAGSLPLRGEEPTRAQVAFEMIEGGDWIVPHEQGDPFLIRPPMHNWLIAASTAVLGRRDVFAVRFPSLIATLLTALLIYGYSRTFLSRTGALAAALSFATLGEMFQMGRQAETEALFIYLVSASVLVWHWGMVRKWRPALTWSAGYALMVLAALAKGPQAPAYFVGSAFAYLVLTRQWRKLFTTAHLCGALAGAVVLGAWLVPFYRALGWSGVREIFFGDPAVRVLLSFGASHILVNQATFPFLVIGGTLPWCALLLVYASRSAREPRPQLVFVTLFLAIGFLSCWLHPAGQTRYFAPMFPALAVLVGWASERAVAAEPLSWPRIVWERYLSVIAGIMLVASVAVLLVACFGSAVSALRPAVEPIPVALLYTAVGVALAVLTWRARKGSDVKSYRTAIVATSSFLAIAFTGVITDVRVRRSEYAAEAVARLKSVLLPGQQLVSFGHTDSLFAYLYGFPMILPRPWPENDAVSEPGLPYFSFISAGDQRPHLPFAWQEIGVVSLDRNHHEPPERVVVVGRRLEETEAGGAEGSELQSPEPHVPRGK